MNDFEDENSNESEGLKIKFFQFTHVNNQLDCSEEVIEQIENLVITKIDVKYVFENIFEIFSDEDIDLSKIKKIFLLTRKILNNEKKGKKIFEDLLISNHNQFIEYYCKNEFILSEDNEICEVYNDLKVIFENFRSNINDKIDKISENIENKKSKYFIKDDEIEKDENYHNFEDKNKSSNVYNIKSYDLSQSHSLPSKRVSLSSGGLLNFNNSDVKQDKNIRQSILASEMNDLIENTFSSSHSFSHKSNNNNLKNLQSRKLIEDAIYNDEQQIDQSNIFTSINKSTGEKDIQLISINLLLKSIIHEEEGKYKYNISNALITQSAGIITLENLLNLLKSYLSDNKVTNGLIKFINNILLFKYNPEIKESEKLKSSLLHLYEIIERSDIQEFKFNSNKNVLVNDLKKIIKSQNFQDSNTSLLNFAGIPAKIYHNLDYSANSPMKIPEKPKNYLDLYDWSEEEIARQLTLVTFYLFSNIQPNELINSQWTKSDKKINAEYVTKMIDRFNKLSYWITEEILAYDKGKIRAKILEKFIHIANELKEMKNYNDCFCIITALGSFPVKSLLKTWKRISFDAMKTFKQLLNLCSYSRNYAALREEIEDCYAREVSCIPYLGFFLKELAFIDEGPKYIRDNLVNIEKIKKVGKIIEIIQKFQNFDYPFKPIFRLACLSEPAPLEENELSDISTKLDTEPKFKLYCTKSKFKRLTNTDIKYQNLDLPKTFTDLIQRFNVNKSNRSLKERIEMHFSAIN